ncbi:V-type proton ATPase subunit [Dirofilaria immitis]
MFLISAPIQDWVEKSWLKLEIIAFNFASFSNIQIPNFQAASKTELYELSKDLLHLDHSVESLFRSLLSTFESVLLQEDVDLLEHLIIQKQSYVSEETVIDTDYIQSVYVAVPHQSEDSWLETYETIHDSVVACSSCFVAEDSDYKLYSVVIVCEDFLEFRENCAKFGFIARGYRSDPDGYARKLHEQRKLEEATRYQNVFRAYIGSLLRYGEAKFQIIMFYPRKNLSQRLQAELKKFYEKQQDKNDTNESDSEAELKKGSSHLPFLIYKISMQRQNLNTTARFI